MSFGYENALRSVNDTDTDWAGAQTQDVSVEEVVTYTQAIQTRVAAQLLSKNSVEATKNGSKKAYEGHRTHTSYYVHSSP